MKKLFFSISFIIILIFLTSCNINSNNSSVLKNSSNNSSSKKLSISEKDAIEQITKKIGDNNGKRIIDIDGSKTVEGIDYYVVHAYSLSLPLDEEGTQMTYTYGWYYINKSTGQAYEYDMSSQEFKLNPLN